MCLRACVCVCVCVFVCVSVCMCVCERESCLPCAISIEVMTKDQMSVIPDLLDHFRGHPECRSKRMDVPLGHRVLGAEKDQERGIKDMVQRPSVAHQYVREG